MRIRDAVRVILAPTYGLSDPEPGPLIIRDNLYANPVKNVNTDVPTMTTFLLVSNLSPKSKAAIDPGYSVTPSIPGVASLPKG